MRASTHDLEIAEFLKRIGGCERIQLPQFGDRVIELPPHLDGNECDAANDVFGSVSGTLLTDRVVNSVILAPTNEFCLFINNDVTNRMPGKLKSYCSHDKVNRDEERKVNNYPFEYLNSLNASGLPPHILSLKVNSIVLLIKNLKAKDVLVNGTRMRIECLHRNAIVCEPTTGPSRGKRIFIPCVVLIYSGAIMPFDL